MNMSRFLLYCFFCLSVLLPASAHDELIALNVDSYKVCGKTVFYSKGNKFYSYSLVTKISSFINFNIDKWSVGPDRTMIYQKGNSTYLLMPPYTGQGKHLTWNVDSWRWLPDGTLLFQKKNQDFILLDKEAVRYKRVNFNIDKWYISCNSQIAYQKDGSLFFITDKNTGSQVFMDYNVDEVFYLSGRLHFFKDKSLYTFNEKMNTKSLILNNIKSHRHCGEWIHAETGRGLYIISNSKAHFTGRVPVRDVRITHRGITYLRHDRLYFNTGIKEHNLCSKPAWCAVSENGGFYLLRNNSLCYVDETYSVVPVVVRVSKPQYKNNRIYYTSTGHRYYLCLHKGRLFKCN